MTTDNREHAKQRFHLGRLLGNEQPAQPVPTSQEAVHHPEQNELPPHLMALQQLMKRLEASSAQYVSEVQMVSEALSHYVLDQRLAEDAQLAAFRQRVEAVERERDALAEQLRTLKEVDTRSAARLQELVTEINQHLTAVGDFGIHMPTPDVSPPAQSTSDG